MLVNKIQCSQIFRRLYFQSCERQFHEQITKFQTAKTLQMDVDEAAKHSTSLSPTNKSAAGIFPAPRVVPMVLSNKDPVVLSFDDVPGPKSLKYLSNVRHYISEIGTQFTATLLTAGLNISMLFFGLNLYIIRTKVHNHNNTVLVTKIDLILILTLDMFYRFLFEQTDVYT